MRDVAIVCAVVWSRVLTYKRKSIDVDVVRRCRLSIAANRNVQCSILFSISKPNLNCHG